ncbi:MAG: class I SAM-dependent methyltransferase [Phycisphaerales bacterium]|nr:MAG: class I SAM-dependent methyltransferase [Phycisphaerales bacterium]
MARSGPGMRPGQGGPGFMREGFPGWFDELAVAYEQNNREKVGELIAQMKQRMDRMRQGMRRFGPSGPPEPAEGPVRGVRPGGPDRPERPSRPEAAVRGDRPMRPGQVRPGGGGSGTSFMESPPIAKTETEKKILSVLDDMDRNQRRGMMNVPAEDGRLLRLLTETLGAKNVVEIGTSNGYSGIWFCLALQKTGGKLTTHEIDADRASLARENFKKAGVGALVTLVEGDAHEEVTKLKGPIDILFLDADKEGYIDYLDKLLPLVRPGGLVVAHNMNARQADPQYIKAITTNPDLETLLLHKEGSGVSVTLKKR